MENINIYTLTAFSIFVFSLNAFKPFKEDKKVGQLLKLSVLWLIFYEAFRWEIGTDWSYCDEFVYGYDDSDLHIEFGYSLFNSTLRKFTSNYTYLLLIITTFFYFVIYHTVKKYSAVPLMSLCIYYCSMLGYLGCNRQFIALMICLLSVPYIIEKKLKYFLVFVLIAFSFHSTSLVFLFAYFAYNLNIPRKIWFLIIFPSIAFGMLGLADNIPYAQYVVFLDANSTEKMTYYLNGESDTYSLVGTLKRILILIPCFYYLGKEIPKSVELFIKLYFLGCIMYFTFNGSILTLLAGRGAMYFNIAEIIVMPFFIKNLVKDETRQKLVWFGYFSLLTYLMLRDMNYHISAGNLIYLPYKNIFF